MNKVIAVGFIVGIVATGVIGGPLGFLEVDKQQAIKRMNKGTHECEQMERDGASSLAVSGCYLKLLEDIEEACEKYPDLDDRCYAIRVFSQMFG